MLAIQRARFVVMPTMHTFGDRYTTTFVFSCSSVSQQRAISCMKVAKVIQLLSSGDCDSCVEMETNPVANNETVVDGPTVASSSPVLLR